MPQKLTNFRNSMTTFSRKVSRGLSRKSGDRKSLLKKNSSKSFSDITKTSSKSRNPFNDLAKSSSNKRGIGLPAAEYKSKGREIQKYIPNGPGAKPPSSYKRVFDKKPTKSSLINSKNNLNRTGKDTTKNLNKPMKHDMIETEDYKRKARGQIIRENRNNAARSRVMDNLDKLAEGQTSRYQDMKNNMKKRGRAQMDALKRGSGGGIDPTMMYMMMQSKQDADQAAEERRQQNKEANEDEAVSTRQNFFG